jgi:NAD(P)-dependent dehydrogenase (short-subunit alcohol dehydrogenase family)
MDNKIAVITGAGRGLGRSMALHLARQGVGIVGTFRNESDDGFKSTAAEIEASAGPRRPGARQASQPPTRRSPQSGS